LAFLGAKHVSFADGLPAWILRAPLVKPGLFFLRDIAVGCTPIFLLLLGKFEVELQNSANWLALCLNFIHFRAEFIYIFVCSSFC
jgi:hypothetical protein